MGKLIFSAVDYDEENNILYGFAKFYNAFYAVDLNAKTTILLGRLEQESDQEELIFQMLYHDRKLIFSPRQADYIHIFHIDTKKQEIIPWSIFPDQSCTKKAGNFYLCKFLDKSFLISRDKAGMFYFNKEELRIFNVDEYNDVEINHIDQFTYDDGVAVFYDYTRKKIAAIDLLSMNSKVSEFPEKLLKDAIPFHVGSYIYFYNSMETTVTICDFDGNIVKELCLDKEMQSVPYVVPRSFGDDILFFIPNKTYCYVYDGTECKKKYITDLEIKNSERLLCSNGDWIIQQQIKNTDWLPEMQYLKYDGLTHCFVKIDVPVPDNESEDEIIGRLYNRWCCATLKEDYSNGIAGLLSVIDLKKKNIVLEKAQSIGRNIFMNLK